MIQRKFNHQQVELNQEFDYIIEILNQILNKLTELENRIKKLE